MTSSPHDLTDRTIVTEGTIAADRSGLAASTRAPDTAPLSVPVEPAAAGSVGGRSAAESSCSFEVVLADGSCERIDDADAYQQEQSMTTFFRTDGRRQAVDCWSVRVASFRTEHIVAVRRRDAATRGRHLQSV